MNYIALEEVLYLHDRFIQTYGGSSGIRDHHLLESALHRSKASYGGEDLYKNVFEKAAALMHGILFNHPFIDGNKRTALGSAAAMLGKNGWYVKATNEEMVAFPLAVAKTRPDISEMAKWFKDHSVKIKNRSPRVHRLPK